MVRGCRLAVIRDKPSTLMTAKGAQHDEGAFRIADIEFGGAQGRRALVEHQGGVAQLDAPARPDPPGDRRRDPLRELGELSGPADRRT